MIRILIFFSWVVFFAAVLTLFATLKNPIGVEAFGWRADLPVGAAIVAALIALTLLALAISVIKDFAVAPKTARARREIERREKGLAAVTRGLEAIALGDGAAAKREATIAARTLKEAPVAKLIAAQAAHLSGDDAAAGEALAGLLDAPETEFLALRGLYARALRNGDKTAAEGFAARAQALRPQARWAFNALLSLRLERADYDGAREALSAAQQAKTIDRAVADRGVAAAFAASAYGAAAAGDKARALADAEAALKRAAGLAPAAVIAARLLAADDRKKAASRLYEAFSLAPSPSLVDALEEIFSDEIDAARAAALDRLAMKKTDAPEAAFARARAALLRGEAGAAREELETLVASQASPRALRAMAAAQEALNGPVAARAWLDLAATAPRDAAMSADDFRRITSDGWRRLILEYMESGRLAPPPIEAPPPGVDAAAMARLAPPASAQEGAANEPDIEEASPGEAAASDQSAASPDNPDTDEKIDRDAAAARGVS